MRARDCANDAPNVDIGADDRIAAPDASEIERSAGADDISTDIRAWPCTMALAANSGGILAMASDCNDTTCEAADAVKSDCPAAMGADASAWI